MVDRINDARCGKCGLIQPCPCVTTDKEFEGAHKNSKEEPLIILNRRPDVAKCQEAKETRMHKNIVDVALEADRRAEDALFQMKTYHRSNRTLSHIREMFKANPDNKLALKLFGNKAAVLIEQRRQSKQGTGVIHPFSTFRWYWDILLMTFICLHILLLPVSIAFLSDDLSLHWLVLNGISDVFFVIDIFLNFRTGIVDPNNHEEVILEKKIICMKYLRGWFAIDLLSSLPFDYAYFIASSSSAEQTLIKASRALRILKLAKLLSLLRLLRVSRLVRYMRRFEELLNIGSGQLRILKLIGCMLLLSHWNGCVQFLVPYLQEFPHNSWVAINGLDTQPPSVQYSWALFNAMSHMLCIGYGRYPPQNTTELWLTMLSMTIGATFYAVFIGIMSSLIMSIDSSGRLFNEKLNQVEEYMRYRKLPLRLRLQVQEYYEHRFHHKWFNEDAILQELSKSLREDILIHNIRPLLATVPFFSEASADFISDVITKLHFEVYLPGEFICRSGQRGEKMFFIQKGIVDILTRDGTLATSLGDGSHFGEICLLSKESRRVASVRAATTCDLYSLASVHFHDVLLEYPAMKATLEEVARERLARIGLQPKLSGTILPKSEYARPAFKFSDRNSVDIADSPKIALTHAADTPDKARKLVSIANSSTSKGIPLKPSKMKSGGVLTQAFIKSVAPGLASFARYDAQETHVDLDVDVCLDNDDDENDDFDDEDVVATIADF